MTTNQKRAALKKAGITFYVQGRSIIRSEWSEAMQANITTQMHYSVDSIAEAVKQTWENLDVQDKIAGRI